MAPALGLEVIAIPVRSPDELDGAVAVATARQPQALMVVPSRLTAFLLTRTIAPEDESA